MKAKPLFENLLQRPRLSVSTLCTRKGGVGREERQEGENDGVPSYDSSVQGHTKRGRKGFPAMTKASRDTQARRKGEGKESEKRDGERERERVREREREEEGKRRREKEEDRCSQLRTSIQEHTNERGVPECYIQEHSKKAKKEEGEGTGRKGG